QHLAVVPLAGNRIVDRVAALLQHLLDEQVELGEHVAWRVLEVFLERLPAALPFVAVESRLEHRPYLPRPAAFRNRRPASIASACEGTPGRLRRARARARVEAEPGAEPRGAPCGAGPS